MLNNQGFWLISLAYV